MPNENQPGPAVMIIFGGGGDLQGHCSVYVKY